VSQQEPSLTLAYVFEGWRWKASGEYDFSLWHENVMHLADRGEETARRKVRCCGAAVFRSCSRDEGDSSDDQKRQSPARSPHDKSRPRYEHETQKRCLNKYTQRRHPTPLPMTALSGLCNLLRLSSDRNRDTITRLRFFPSQFVPPDPASRMWWLRVPGERVCGQVRV
jgi:hypothetical protein